jgi:thioredoxin 1
MVHYLQSLDEFKTVVEQSRSKLVVIDFTASWCGPCQFIAPHFEQLAKENPDVIFVKVDVDDAEDIARECGIRSMPTFQFYKGGKKVSEFSGADVNRIKTVVASLK